MIFNKDEITDNAIRSILTTIPSLAKFTEQSHLSDYFRCFLDHLEIIFEGKELKDEDWMRADRLIKKLGQSALSFHIQVENLIASTFIFRQIFWKSMETNPQVTGELDSSKLLPTIRIMNEYLAQLNFQLMHVYLEKEREVVAAQQADLLKRRQKIEADLELARRIQQSMFPTLCHYRGFKSCAKMIPTGSIGGDFYGIIPFGHPETRVDLYIGDVQGKGIPAALVMMLLTSTLWDIALGNPNMTPVQIVASANERFRQHMTEELTQFASLFYLSYYPENRTLAYTKAGHEDGVLIRRGDNQIITLSTSGYFLGIFEEADYEEKHLTVHPGDRLYLFTDGVTQLELSPGRGFDYDEFYQILKKHNGLPLGDSIEKICEQILLCQPRNEPLKDDIGLVAAEF